MSVQTRLASWGGKVWLPRNQRGGSCWALFPKPAILWGVPHFDVDSDDYRCLTTLAEPGDMILTRGNIWLFSNMGIAGTAFKHLAVITGSVSAIRDDTGFLVKPKSLGVDRKHTGKVTRGIWERSVTHAIGEGVVTQDLLEVVMHYVDYFAIVRPWTSKEQQQKIVDFALSNNGLGYNFDFTPEGPKELYCTELGVEALKAAGIEPPLTTPINISWKGWLPFCSRKYLYPVALADSFLESFPVIACSKSCTDPRLPKKSRIPEVVRKALMEAKDFRSLAESES